MRPLFLPTFPRLPCRTQGWHVMCFLREATIADIKEVMGGSLLGTIRRNLDPGADPISEVPQSRRIPSMLKRANPTPSKAVDCPSKVERRVMCAGYESCLDEAIKREWVAFSCRHCRSYEPLTLEPTEWLADSLACIALVYVAEYPSVLKQKPRGSIVLKLRRMHSRETVFALS